MFGLMMIMGESKSLFNMDCRCNCEELSFGTGGLRGVMGVGPNKFNEYIVRKVTQGLANFAVSKNIKDTNKKIVIAYDSRHKSYAFALEAALVLIANNFKVYFFDSMRPTPELSYAVRYLKCFAGIVITASHNPAEYNGYKIYNSDGGQIIPNTANMIADEIRNIKIPNDIKLMSEQEAIESKMLVYIGSKVDNLYLSKVEKVLLRKNVVSKAKDFKIVYTPLHGTGMILMDKIFKKLNYSKIEFVESQVKPDGNFPTVKFPNPEEEKALSEGIKLAIKTNADIVLGTDPDCDRVGVAVRNDDKNYQVLTGNQVGALLIEYITISKNKITSKDAVVKTIVTSDLGAKIAKAYGATVFNTLTGFKFIGEKIEEFERTGKYNFLFGYEESNGYLVDTFVRDKDAIIASVLIAEMAAFYKLNGMTLLNAMERIYKKYGYYCDSLESLVFKDIEEQNKIKNIFGKFKKQEWLFKKFDNIETIEDYTLQRRSFVKTKNSELIKLPKSDVVKIYFENKSWIAVRPSGTEPKLKVYYSAVGDSFEISKNIMSKLKSKIKSLDLRKEDSSDEDKKLCS